MLNVVLFSLIVVIVVLLLIGLYCNDGLLVLWSGILMALAGSWVDSTQSNLKSGINGGTILSSKEKRDIKNGKGKGKSRYSGYEYTCEELKSFTIDPDLSEAIKTRDYTKILVTHLYHPKNITKPLTVLSRVLKPDAPRLPYTRKTGQFKRQLHWGQLKLFLTEIEFINLAIARYGKDRKFYVLYIGAAPGNHTTELAAMYNDHGLSVYFDLWDGNPYVCRPIPGRIEIHESLFFDKDAKFYKEKFDKMKSDKSDKNAPVILLISDIRSASDEKAVAFDMGLQLGWWKALEPDMCMYKFRLPWSPGKTKYAEGEIYIQPFPGVTSSETRLIIDKRLHGMRMKEYDNTTYEEQCFYHNNLLRGQPYYPTQLFTDTKHALTLERDGMCNCYDCMSMAILLHEYLGLVGKSNKLTDVLEYAKHLERHTGGGSGGATLLSQTLANFKNAIAVSKSC